MNGKHSHYNLVTIPFFLKIPIAFSAFKIPLKFTKSDRKLSFELICNSE